MQLHAAFIAVLECGFELHLGYRNKFFLVRKEVTLVTVFRILFGPTSVEVLKKNKHFILFLGPTFCFFFVGPNKVKRQGMQTLFCFSSVTQPKYL